MIILLDTKPLTNLAYYLIAGKPLDTDQYPCMKTYEKLAQNLHLLKENSLTTEPVVTETTYFLKHRAKIDNTKIADTLTRIVKTTASTNLHTILNLKEYKQGLDYANTTLLYLAKNLMKQSKLNTIITTDQQLKALARGLGLIAYTILELTTIPQILEELLHTLRKRHPLA